MKGYDAWKTRSDLDDPAALNHAPPLEDDRLILAVGRALRERGGQLAFGEAIEVDEGFKVDVSISASVTVPLQENIAHGRRLTLEKLIKRRE